MKRKIKSNLILCLIIISLVTTGINLNKFKVIKYEKDNQNSKNDDISELSTASWDLPITRSVENEPYSVFIGDANNDGFNDVVAANLDSSTVSILLWNITSSNWDPPISRDVGGSGPISTFIGDANNDGFNDIATANLYSNTVSILIWDSILDNWDSPITRYVGDAPFFNFDPYDIFIGDANNDGFNDIATANWFTETVSILLWNNSLGNWNSQILRAVESSPYDIFIGDANNDGFNDIATSNYLSDDVSILLWNSTSGDWDPQITQTVGSYPYEVFIRDANNDGFNDIVTANAAGSHVVSILLWNNTLSNWDPQITRDVGEESYSVFIGDANNDGFNDIATANMFADTISILLWNNTLGDWDPPLMQDVGSEPYSVFIGDANNDGYNDITTANEGSNTVSILLWKSQLNLISPINKTYIEPMSGYYLGTFGFENDEDGVSQPEGFDNFYASSCNGTVFSEIDGHKKVFGAYDSNNAGSAIIKQRFNDFGFQNQTLGTVEYWFRVTSIGVNTEIRLNWGYGNGDAAVVFRIQGSTGHWQQNNGTWIPMPNIPNPVPNAWYHIQIHFRCQGASSYLGLGENEYELIINGISSGALSFAYNSTEIALFMPILTAGGVYYGNYAYMDAIGYSWDLNYRQIGDNTKEGLLLSFETRFTPDWLGYSLNGQSNKTILGNTTIYKPELGIHSIQVFGSDSLGNIYSSVLRYFKVKGPITVLTPENKTYTEPMSGYYLATFGFEHDKDSSDPNGWVILNENPEAEIISELDGHNKVLRLYDTVGGSGNPTRIYNNFTDMDYGTVEVWMQQDDLGSTDDRGQITGMSNGSILFGVRMWGGTTPKWKAIDNGTAIDIPGALTPVINTWYHIRIDFEHTPGGYQGLGQNEYFIYIDGIRYGPYLFDVDRQLNELYLHTYSYGAGYNVYFDAVGYSWDPEYNIGDNKEEGLLLSFETEFIPDWLGYSLDGQTNKTILGNELIVFPNDGLHKVQFFGNSSIGKMYKSNLRYFTMDTTAPTSLILFKPYSDMDIVNKSTEFTITANDGIGSGVSMIRYKINDSSWITYIKPFNLSDYTYGYYLITYQAIDKVGNIETENTLLVLLVKLPSKKQEISGFSTFLILSLIGLVSFILIKRYKK